MNQKLEVMIVDDEILVANLLKNCIDWESIGLTVCEIATSASEALDMIEDRCPDIIFTDIRMPVIDGLSFAKQVIMDHPNIKIIILTGYDDFEYARGGISIGVLEYIQKPINNQEIEQAAIKARDQILQERKVIDDYRNIKKHLQENMDYLKEKFLNGFITGSITKERLENAKQYYDITPQENTLTVAVLEITPKEESDEDTRQLLSYSAFKLLRLSFEKKDRVYIFHDVYQRVILLFFTEEIERFEYTSQIQKYISRQLPCSICVGIGGTYTLDEDYQSSYREACSALKYAQANKANEIIDIQDFQISNPVKEYHIDDIENLIFFVRIGIVKKASEILNQFFMKMKKQTCSVQSMKIVASGIIAGVTQSIILSGLEGVEAFSTQSSIVLKIYSAETVFQVFDLLKGYIIETTEKISSIRTKVENSAIIHVKEYLEKNYSDTQLTLSIVAKDLNYNQSYLSRLFKRETGKGFREYLMAMRISQAIQLLLDTDMRSYQIAEAAGFVDPNYFSTCFKKQTGMTVSDYRINHKN